MMAYNCFQNSYPSSAITGLLLSVICNHMWIISIKMLHFYLGKTEISLIFYLSAVVSGVQAGPFNLVVLLFRDFLGEKVVELPVVLDATSDLLNLVRLTANEVCVGAAVFGLKLQELYQVKKRFFSEVVLKSVVFE